MSNYALIKNGIVENVIVADADFIASLTNPNDYVEYTNAGIGWTYDGVNFISPQPYLSWTRDNGNWLPPSPYPNDGKFYRWDEATTSWVEAPAL